MVGGEAAVRVGGGSSCWWEEAVGVFGGLCLFLPPPKKEGLREKMLCWTLGNGSSAMVWTVRLSFLRACL